MLYSSMCCRFAHIVLNLCWDYSKNLLRQGWRCAETLLRNCSVTRLKLWRFCTTDTMQRLSWAINKKRTSQNIFLSIPLFVFQFWETIAGEHGILPNGKFDTTAGKLKYTLQIWNIWNAKQETGFGFVVKCTLILLWHLVWPYLWNPIGAQHCKKTECRLLFLF